MQMHLKEKKDAVFKSEEELKNHIEKEHPLCKKCFLRLCLTENVIHALKASSKANIVLLEYIHGNQPVCNEIYQNEVIWKNQGEMNVGRQRMFPDLTTDIISMRIFLFGVRNPPVSWSIHPITEDKERDIVKSKPTENDWQNSYNNYEPPLITIDDSSNSQSNLSSSTDTSDIVVIGHHQREPGSSPIKTIPMRYRDPVTWAIEHSEPKKATENDHALLQEACMYCQKTLEIGDLYAFLPCNHVLHLDTSCESEPQAQAYKAGRCGICKQPISFKLSQNLHKDDKMDTKKQPLITRQNEKEDEELVTPEKNYIATAFREDFIEKIMDTKIVDGKIQYLIKWAGFPVENASWATKEYLTANGLIDEKVEEKQNLEKKQNEVEQEIVDKSPEFKSNKRKRGGSESGDNPESGAIPEKRTKSTYFETIINGVGQSITALGKAIANTATLLNQPKKYNSKPEIKNQKTKNLKKPECRRGSKCKFYKKGNCHFLHQ